MKKLISLLSIVFALNAQAQTKMLTSDTTGKAYVVFVREDSIAVVFQGRNTAFTSDGLFAKDFAAFDLSLKGFFRLEKIAEVKTPEIPIKKEEIIIPPILPASSTGITKVFPAKANYGKSRYIIEPTDWSKVSAAPQSIEGMGGYDFAPIEANQGESIYRYGEWKQSYVSIAGKRDVWKDGNATYYLKPFGYSTDLSYNLMDFDLRFPDFTLPKGKLVVMQPTPLRERNVNIYLKKGVSFSKDAAGKDGYRFVADDWLTDLGCPIAYVTTQAAMDKWCEQVDADELLNSFIDKIYYPNRDFGYVMLNWEAVGYRWNVRKDKLQRCLEYWQTHPHTAKLGLWTVSGISMGRPIFQGYGFDFSELLTFNGDLESFRQKYDDYIDVDFSYAKYADVGHIGGYQNYPMEDGVIHHYLMELLLHKKFNPNKPVLATIWFDHEPINNFDLERIKVVSDAGVYFAQVKPKVLPSTAFNWGVWTMLGYGFDCWSDPNYWSENKSEWGWGANDANGNPLPNNFGEFYSKYPAQPMKNIDWLMSGVWAMSQNKDIVESRSEWTFATLPTKSFHDKSLLLAYKLSNDGNEALVVALDGFGKVDGETTHSVSIAGKSYSLKTYGRFTSVIRLKL